VKLLILSFRYSIQHMSAILKQSRTSCTTPINLHMWQPILEMWFKFKK